MVLRWCVSLFVAGTVVAAPPPADGSFVVAGLSVMPEPWNKEGNYQTDLPPGTEHYSGR